MKFKSLKNLIFILSMTLFLVMSSSAMAADIRVCLNTSATTSQFEITGESSYNLKTDGIGGNIDAMVNVGDSIKIVRSGSKLTVYVNGVSLGSTSSSLTLKANKDDVDEADEVDAIVKYGTLEYRGNFAIHTNGYVVNILDMEEYLYGVIGKEMGYSAPYEALKAQSIVSRSYAYSCFGGTYYDVLATVSSQVYQGYTVEKSSQNGNAKLAVDETENLVMYYNGDVVPAVYCASAGGHTEDNENIWGNAANDALRGVPSPYDDTGYHMNWQVEYTADEIEDKAADYMVSKGISGSFGTFEQIKCYDKDDAGTGVTASGRVTTIQVIGSGKVLQIDGDAAIRSFLGTKSSLFKIVSKSNVEEAVEKVHIVDGDDTMVERPWTDVYAVNEYGDVSSWKKADNPSIISSLKQIFIKGSDHSAGVVITGSGWGHGVGMSQYGAMGMAKDDYSYDEILYHYYGADDDKLEIEEYQK